MRSHRSGVIRFILLAALVSVVVAPAGAHDPRPVGDGNISSEPRRGLLFSCQQRFNPNAPGSRRTGVWIEDGIFYPDRKPIVGGSVTWPDAFVEVTVEGVRRVVRANNLQTHATGIFPIRRTDPAYEYDRNPGRIREQDIQLNLPLVPQRADVPSCVPMGMIAFTLVGGALYNALDARGRDAAAHEILDRCAGHPQQQGQYHYHDHAPCLTEGVDANGHSVLVAYALDGFGVFGNLEVGGRALGNDDLDECHGHTGPARWNGAITEVYHYHLTDAYPYSIGCFRGTPVTLAPPGGGNGRPQAGGPGRHQGQGRAGGDPIAAVARDLNLDPDALRRAVGPPPPDIRRAARELGVDERRLREAFERQRLR